MNKQWLELVGRITSTPEVQKSKEDKAYSKIPLAVNWKRKGKDGKEVEEVTYYNVLVFGKRAEKSGNLEKGKLVRALGSLEVRPYTSKKNEAKADLTVVAKEFQVFDLDAFK